MVAPFEASQWAKETKDWTRQPRAKRRNSALLTLSLPLRFLDFLRRWLPARQPANPIGWRYCCAGAAVQLLQQPQQRFLDRVANVVERQMIEAVRRERPLQLDAEQVQCQHRISEQDRYHWGQPVSPVLELVQEREGNSGQKEYDEAADSDRVHRR